MTTVHDAILAQLDAAGATYRLHEHRPLVTVEDYDRHSPFPLPQFLKTIVFGLKDDWHVLAAVKGEARVSYKRLAAALNVNRRQLRSLPPAAVTAALGFEIGGVGPFAPGRPAHILVDAALDDDEIVFCGSGRNTATLEIRLGDLVRAAGARRVRLTD